MPHASLVEQIKNQKGRKPKPKRKKPRYESPTKKKVSREKRIMHYSICDHAGHKKSKCLNFGVERYKPPMNKKKSLNARE